MFRITFFTIGTKIVASSRTRVYQYIHFFQREGIKCRIIPYNTSFFIRRSIRNLSESKPDSFSFLFDLIEKFIHLLKFLQIVISSYFFDILFIQKVILSPLLYRIIYKLNKKIVFDFDDSTFFLKNNYEVIKEILKNAKLVIVNNKYNADQVKQFNSDILIIPSPIDTDYYFPQNNRINRKRKDVVIGWIGHPEHANYLFRLKNVFSSLCKKYPRVQLMVIGAGDLVMEEIKLEKEEWSLDSEVLNLQKFDIGIMPLHDDEVAQGKGGYKLLQYMSIGIPCVASPVGLNCEIIREGENGFLAKTEKEWFKKLSILIENEEIRHKMGKAGRRIAIEEYSFYAAVPKLLRALKDAAKSRQN